MALPKSARTHSAQADPGGALARLAGDDGVAAWRARAILAIAAGLVLIGIVMVGSTGVSVERGLVQQDMWRTPFGRQIIFAGAACAVMLCAARFGGVVLGSKKLLRIVIGTVCALALIGLVAALLPGVGSARHGSNRWLSLAVGGFTMGIQPSELTKIALVLFLSAWFASERCDVRSLKRGFLPAAGAVGLFVGLVGVEDFGTSVLLVCVSGALLLVAGVRWLHLGTVATIGAAGMVGLLLAAPYRMKRILAYRDFFEHADGDGYQPVQSLMAIHSGGWFGRGLGGGVHKYGYLPESETDFIFAVLCEETGVIGAMLVVGLYLAIVVLALQIARCAASRFERFVAVGIGLTVGLQAAMNMAVVTAFAPTTGISLPLISYGGSGLVTFSFSLGILAAIALRGAAGATNEILGRRPCDASAVALPA